MLTNVLVKKMFWKVTLDLDAFSEKVSRSLLLCGLAPGKCSMFVQAVVVCPLTGSFPPCIISWF